jgi:hypothetical protein
MRGINSFLISNTPLVTPPKDLPGISNLPGLVLNYKDKLHTENLL